jgi:hypothetical protein
MASIEVYRVGQDVKIGVGEKLITAKVLQIAIHANESVQYQVVWWDGRTRKVEWLEAIEARCVRSNYAGTLTKSDKIGFRSD